ncbi:MAG TPA: DUF502 domain-containing protein [Kiritimatiellia bacterium]|nr:DUF502 domain-containing protein [Kiritimatiellia bacterium]HRU71067.1 DUF502 domain-containing protein [Kiritimatiellia bacterium]
MKSVADPSVSARVGVHIRNRLMSGLLVLIPLAITLFVLRLLFNWLTAFARPLLRSWLGELNETALALIALAVTVAVLYAVGLVATHLVGRRLIHFGERVLLRLPIVKTVYSASKQVVDAFSASGKSSFEAVVMVEYPRRGAYAIGFVTGAMSSPDGKKLLTVFVATTPNPTSGFLILYPEEEVYFTDIPVEDGIKMIVSGGMLVPKHFAFRGRGQTGANEPQQDADDIG